MLFAKKSIAIELIYDHLQFTTAKCGDELETKKSAIGEEESSLGEYIMFSLTR